MKSKIMKLNSKIVSCGSVVGETEHEGDLGKEFDMYDEKDKFSMDTWEKAESEMQRIALSIALKKGNIPADEIDMIFAGDLLNQCTGSAYGLLSFDSPYFGLYSACATCAEGLMLSAMATSAGYCETACAVTSSHNCTAERQYRTPIEYGGQKPPTAQWTVTGAGAFVVKRAQELCERMERKTEKEREEERMAEAKVETESETKAKPEADGKKEQSEPPKPKAYITEALAGIVKDSGISDANNMGAAMAGAAEDTLIRYLREGNKKASDFDMVLTGDLGELGSRLFRDLVLMDGYNIENIHYDCGCMIYKTEKRAKAEGKRPLHDVNCGGSGCGCSASVLAGHILPRIERGELSKVIFIATGAMMSPSSVQQGLCIPSIAHLVLLESPENFKTVKS